MVRSNRVPNPERTETELRVHAAQLAHEAVPHEFWRRETALAMGGRLEIHDRRADRRHDAVGEPRPNAGLETAGKGLRDPALAPAAEAGMGVRGAEIELLPRQVQFRSEPPQGQVRHFGRNDQRIRPEHDAQPVADAQGHRLDIQIVGDARGGCSVAIAITGERERTKPTLGRIILRRVHRGREQRPAKAGRQIAADDRVRHRGRPQPGRRLDEVRRPQIRAVIHAIEPQPQRQEQQGREPGQAAPADPQEFIHPPKVGEVPPRSMPNRFPATPSRSSFALA